MEGDITQRATVLCWRGIEHGIKAAKEGHDVIMAPTAYCYFDYYQTADPKGNEEPLAIGGCLPLRKCYEFDPFDQLNDDEKAHIRGIQANLWTEYIATFDHVQFMVLPRIAALAEVAWNPDGRTEYGDFVDRIVSGLLPIYDLRGYNYAPYAFKDIE